MSTTPTADELLMSGGILGFKWSVMGETFVGTIVEEPKVAQATDPKTGEAQFWPSGDRKLNIVLVCQTSLRDPADAGDDGKRRFYISSRMMPAVRDAVKTAGAKGLAAGGRIAVRWISGSGQGEGNARSYAAEYAPPVVDPGSMLATTPAATPAPAAAPPASAIMASLQPATPAPTGGLLAGAATINTAAMAPPNGVDPAVWANLPEAQRQAIVAAMSNPAATAPAY